MFTLHIEDMNGGPTHEHTFTEGVLLIGRSREKCDIVLPSDNVSRNHARLYTVDDRCFLEDLKSANGVFVDGDRLGAARELDSQTRFRIGDYVLWVTKSTEPLGDPGEVARLEGFNLFEGKTYNLSDEVTLIGRGKDTGVTIIDPSVSRMHAKLTRAKSGEFLLQDLRSSNGTRLNERLIEEGVVTHGDHIRFGNVDFKLVLGGRAVSPASPPTVTPENFKPAAQAQGEQDQVERTAADEIPRGRGRPLRWGGFLALVVALVAVGLYLHAGRSKQGGDESDAPGSPATAEERARSLEERRMARRQERLGALLTDVQEYIANHEWQEAIESGERALLIEPEHPTARTMIAMATRERRAQKGLESAEEARRMRRFAEALAGYEAVPSDSVYHERASLAAEAVRALRPSLLLEAEELRRRDRSEACERLREALSIDGSEDDLSKELRRLEPRCPAL